MTSPIIEDGLGGSRAEWNSTGELRPVDEHSYYRSYVIEVLI